MTKAILWFEEPLLRLPSHLLSRRLRFFGPQTRDANFGLNIFWAWWWPGILLTYPVPCSRLVLGICFAGSFLGLCWGQGVWAMFLAMFPFLERDVIFSIFSGVFLSKSQHQRVQLFEEWVGLLRYSRVWSKWDVSQSRGYVICAQSCIVFYRDCHLFEG